MLSYKIIYIQIARAIVALSDSFVLSSHSSTLIDRCILKYHASYTFSHCGHVAKLIFCNIEYFNKCLSVILSVNLQKIITVTSILILSLYFLVKLKYHFTCMQCMHLYIWDNVYVAPCITAYHITNMWPQVPLLII